MSVYLKTTKEDIDYEAVAALLNSFGMSGRNADEQERIFKSSYAVSFLYDGDKLIGCARALSDGVCEAALYNIALAREYHGRKLGRMLIESILEQVRGCNIILYTHPRTVAMYEKFGFRRHVYSSTQRKEWNADDLKRMEKTGFLLPEGYRFSDNELGRSVGGNDEKTEI